MKNWIVMGVFECKIVYIFATQFLDALCMTTYAPCVDASTLQLEQLILVKGFSLNLKLGFI